MPHSFTFDAIGTAWEIKTEQAIPIRLKKKILKQIEYFDLTYSRFRTDSLVAKIASRAGKYQFPMSANHLIRFYESMYALTDGKMTPLIGEMLERAGYDATYSLASQVQTRISAWRDAMSWDVEHSMLATSDRVTLDFGAAGKGYLVDLIGLTLEEAGIDTYIIDASGDMRHAGKLKMTVGLEHPLETNTVIGVVDIRNESLCASATNRRVWGDGLHHIFDPDTKEPVHTIIATWVISSETMIADGLATALFLTDPNRLSERYDYQYVRMFSDQSVEYSKNFKGELFT